MFVDTKSSSRWSEMISVLFSLPKIQDGRHIDILSMLSDLLKKRKYEVTISLLSLNVFFSKPMESYLDHQYFIILNLST